MGKIFDISIKDFLTKKFILLSLLPLLGAVLVLGILAFFGGKEGFENLQIAIANGDFTILQNYPIISKILNYSITKWIIGAFFYIAGTFLVLIFSVIIAVIIAGFLTPVVTKEINLRHYNLERQNEVSFLKVVKLMATSLLKFIAIFLICLVFYFVPILNLFVINIPFFYLFYKFLLIDVASNSLNKERFEKIYKKGGGYKFMLSCFLFYLLCLIPLVGLFLQLFFVIFLSHILYQNEQKLGVKKKFNEIK